MWRVLLRVIDIETTGLAPPAEIIEFGRVDVNTNGTVKIGPPLARLYRPLNGIPPETMAIHHLTETDFKPDTPICTVERLQLAVWGGPKPDALVAHNCDFERSFISSSISKNLPWICTYRVALRVWPEAPLHSNQVLRYWKGLNLDPALAMPPHRAGPDAWVTAYLLAELLQIVSVEEMISWTSQPKQFPSMPFGIHRGRRWRDIPTPYLEWLARQAGMDRDVISCAELELKSRLSAH